MSLVVVARWRTTTDSQEHIATLLPDFAATALATPGCLSFEAARSTSDSRSFTLIERYTDRAAFERHLAGADYQRMLNDLILPHLVLRERDMYVPLPP
ncbi:putative quinol monooxygenase [Streptomyces acidiscabies]|uniref:Antibiotic biosynthesis monooxygenase n=1 Tax=Streptomyces acidiscabies TaxID=42234 RepID=A0AAP6BDE0_9ACTN|nr:antibiotic biosynthesis monooxygenase family protein [Streptomyces acidiscabies]MBP5934663.1 antibiotic biosynthesis monooxygenase [Streptomyces sp. LBUM 1476]MBZ3917616.1 antibiotic biosynthesis monooxygenase [Streptomyces acidiscabies]MDX2962697.1 antibiotic biosynthesis monooxygenase [Streptomyces acidiscabies]MDX3018996.1 antibiotic biosynthesis monooxygenase [Streptomyces acidiscabies]MDX3790332.1 antibiotic biosynthesis monooxygenase [Streptomyces acidiscabies]